MVKPSSYFKQSKDKNVLVFGIAPPPRGGVSVHVERINYQINLISKKLVFIDGIKEYSSKLKYFFKVFKAIWLFRPDLIFYHNISLHYYPLEFFLIIFFKFFLRYKVVNINHNCRHFDNMTKFLKKIYSFLFKFVDKQVFIGSSNYNAYIKNKLYISKSYSIESAFIEPLDQELKINNLPQKLLSFIESKSPLFLINLSKFALYKGKDLYGVDLALKSLDSLHKKYPNLGLVIAVSQDTEKLKSIYNLKSLNYVYILENYVQSLCPILKKIDIFIRPTRIDGYSVSLEEALFLGAKSIASNVVERPKGVILFKPDNWQDLSKNIEKALNY